MQSTVTTIDRPTWYRRFILFRWFFNWLDGRKWIGTRLRMGNQERTVIGYKNDTIIIDRAWNLQPGSGDNFIVTYKPINTDTETL